jgi:hypothetical protein
MKKNKGQKSRVTVPLKRRTGSCKKQMSCKIVWKIIIYERKKEFKEETFKKKKNAWKASEK